jgi:hypothetical protein
VRQLAVLLALLPSTYDPRRLLHQPQLHVPLLCRLLCATASTLMPNFTLPLYDPSACCMFRTLAGMYLDPAAKGDPIDYMQVRCRGR